MSQVAAFFVVTFLVSWACFFGSAEVTPPGTSPATGLAGAIMHAAVNNTTGLVPSATADATSWFSLNASLIAWLTLGLMWIIAAWCLWHMRGSTRRDFPPVLCTRQT